MSETADKGTWVEIHSIVLKASERAAQVPGDTRKVPLEMRAKGFLTAPGVIGEEVEIMTAAGRRVRGTLAATNPPYSHGFGPPIPELAPIGGEVRAMLRRRE